MKLQDRLLPLIVGMTLIVHSGSAQDEPWRNQLFSFTEPEAFFGGLEIDAPEGYEILAAPSENAAVVREVSGPVSIKVVNYTEEGLARYYLTPAEQDIVWDGGARPPQWIRIKGTGRGDFISKTVPAKMIKEEVRDFFKEGPVKAEIWEETVSLAPITEWGPAYRRAEIDFEMPVKIERFLVRETGLWELSVTVFPAFDSNINRIPGVGAEEYGDPYKALITKPVQREIMVRGNSNAAALQNVFLPGTVWAGGFSEGRLQKLRLGTTDLPPALEVSRLSVPLFKSDSLMSFRFAVTKLQEPVMEFEVTPDRIVGADFTEYTLMAGLGGPYPNAEETEWHRVAMHLNWNVQVRPDEQVEVVAPLMEGRGAAGILNLESLDLGPTYEEDLAALVAFGALPAPEVTNPDPSVWIDIMQRTLGAIPTAQRGEETPSF